MELFTFIIHYLLVFHIKYVTILTCWNNKDICKFQEVLSNVQIRSADRFSINNLNGFHITITEANCTKYADYITKVELNYNNKWLFLTNLDQFSKMFIKLRLDSDVKVLDYTTNFVYDVYATNGKIINLGSIQHLRKYSIYNQRKDLSGTNINVSTIFDQTSNLSIEKYLLDTKFKYLNPQDKTNFGLFNILKKYHNFNSSLVPFLKAGFKEDLLESCEFSIASCFINKDAVGSFDFIMPHYLYRTCFVFRNPGNFEGRNEYVDTMSSEVWYCILGTTFLVIGLLKIVYFFDINFNQRAEELVRTNCREGKEWSAVISDTLSILIQQGSNYEPTCISGKIILFSYLFLAVLLYNYYTAVMVSDLLSHPPPPFQNIQQVAKTGIRLSNENNSLTKSFFNESEVEEYDLVEGVRLIKEGTIAFHAQTDTVYSLIEVNLELKEMCDLNELSIAKPQEMYVFLKKGSQYKEIFTITYRKMIELGIFKRVSSKWLTGKPTCLANRDISVAGTTKCKPIYITFTLGCLLSVLILMYENFKMRKLKGFRSEAVGKLFNKG